MSELVPSPFALAAMRKQGVPESELVPTGPDFQGRVQQGPLHPNKWKEVEAELNKDLYVDKVNVNAYFG